ncbi:hypothetical protein BB559_003726 [Furculomyces boomerangus]|uniref:Deacetylase sirtuin-type domain-containing protein n=2 Tax=Harpellales TaxID=61421 RepID=A0A2T9YJC6_9FUNG|nr:hypothetical protein BB559_003726 [Furculomyces boomerangus]PVZ98276.1 hypothetical protein BB558_005724 [Smittium angustum]PVZ99937.1 hypothetical protein BB558_004029 [Smittium angustum]
MEKNQNTNLCLLTGRLGLWNFQSIHQPTHLSETNAENSDFKTFNYRNQKLARHANKFEQTDILQHTWKPPARSKQIRKDEIFTSSANKRVNDIVTNPISLWKPPHQTKIYKKSKNIEFKKEKYNISSINIQPETVSDTSIQPEIVSNITAQPESTSDIKIQPESTEDITFQPESTEDTITQPENVSDISTQQENTSIITIQQGKISDLNDADTLINRSESDVTKSLSNTNTNNANQRRMSQRLKTRVSDRIANKRKAFHDGDNTGRRNSKASRVDDTFIRAFPKGVEKLVNDPAFKKIVRECAKVEFSIVENKIVMSSNKDKIEELAELLESNLEIAAKDDKPKNEDKAHDSTKKSEKEENIPYKSNLADFAKYISNGKAKNIVVLSGAGISTNSGIPDFRSPDGLYANLDKFDLPYPEAVFDIDFFEPSISHCFVKLLADKGVLLRNYTQNIDTLERVAGLESKYIVEAHGSFHAATCIGKKCYTSYTQEWVKSCIDSEIIPKCRKCSSYVKPNIVFFGEQLPQLFHTSIKKDFTKCDLLIIMGTSLTVFPFASLVTRVKGNVPRALINREVVGLTIGDQEGLCFEENDKSKRKVRDHLFLGDCDNGCIELAKLLGWDGELLENYNKLKKSHKEKTSSL